jgi:hypothetical protein
MEAVSHSQAVAPKPATLCSKVTNGRRVFAIGGDGRGAWTRRWRDLHDAHIADLGGLAAGLSEAQISLCRRSAALEVELEQLEAKMSLGEAKIEDLDLYNRLSGNLRRILESLGLERRARPVSNGVLEHFDKGRG